MVNEKIKRDIYFKKLTELKKEVLKVRVDIAGVKENELEYIQTQFKKCDYLIMLCESGETQTFCFK